MRVEVYAIRINGEMDETYIDRALPYLTAQRRERVQRFRRKEDARRSVTAEVLVRWLAASKLRLTNDHLAFGENSYKKPHLLTDEAWHYNVSHSGEWVVCAIHDSPVGVDIEYIQPIEFEVAKNFFTIGEYNELMSKPSSEQLAFFYELWTMKESYIKAIGKGLSVALDSFSFVRDEALQTIVVKHEIEPRYEVKNLSLEQGYALAVCAERCEPFTLAVFEEELLYRSFLQGCG